MADMESHGAIVLEVFVAITLLSILPVAKGQEYPFRNTSLPFSQRVQVGSLILAPYEYLVVVIAKSSFSVEMKSHGIL